MTKELAVESTFLQTFLQSAWNAPMLSPEREVELANLMKEPGATGKRARDLLVTSHIRLSAKLAREFARRNRRPLEDCIQEANIGLLIAVDKFDVSRGFRFATMAFHWIRAQLQSYSRSNDEPVRLPEKRVRQIRKLKAIVGAIEKKGGTATEELVAERMEVTIEELHAITESMIYMVSIHAPIGDGETEFGELLVDDSAADAVAMLIESARLDALTDALSTLLPRERDILIKRNGLDGGDKRTLEELGTEHGVSKERIRQIESRAMKKIRGLLHEEVAGS